MITHPENYFYLRDGGILRDMQDMLHSLRSMPDEVFSHHVNSEKNDFSNWTRDVLNEKQLATRLASAKSRDKMIEKIEKRLEVLTKSRNKKRIIQEIKEVYLNE